MSSMSTLSLESSGAFGLWHKSTYCDSPTETFQQFINANQLEQSTVLWSAYVQEIGQNCDCTDDTNDCTSHKSIAHTLFRHERDSDLK